MVISSFNLSNLDGTNGFTINGIAAGDGSGYSVSSAGDVNNDGFDDLIIGARLADPNGTDSGQSYVVFGSSNGFSSTLNLSNLNGTNGFTINGIAAVDYSGWSLGSAGDVNNDGIADVIIGAPLASPNGLYSGQSYVVFGKSTGFDATLNLYNLDGTNGFTINGIAAVDYSGWSLGSAGDVNNDGIADLIIGAPYASPNGLYSGQSYVVFGKSTGFDATLNLYNLDGTNGFTINGIAAGDGSGISVSSAGDVNDDGIADLIIGASGVDPNGSASGQSYVVFGKSTGFDATLNLSDLNGANGFTINGIAASDYSGYSVSSAGDVNNDGIADLIIGARYADFNGYSSSGQSYVVFGKNTGFSATLNLSSLNGYNGFTINGIAAYDESGVSVSSAGDVNSDGFDDLIIGAYIADPNGSGSGQSYVVFGNTGFSSTLNLSTLNGANGFTINGIAGNDLSGYSVSSAGDINSDGFDDLIIGAPGADPNGSESGQSYVLFGGTNIGGTPELTGTPRADTLIGTINKDIIDGKAGNDTIDGKAGNDLLQGGAGNDILIGGAGNDTLVGGIGADKFLYDTNARFDIYAIGLDTISDFKQSQGDKIVLDKTTFSAITSAVGTGFSNASNFEVTTNGAASTAVIVYNPVTGQLFYNTNGSVAGFGIGGPFAVLTGAPTLAASDFVLQA
ncbi:hypothetical protein [Nostoc sp. CHAB 5715]|uniref:beta strand repeat-containing protein n=1 Tax=Nostoc sp. CHAB 5715 TaxID=2780400 RepID=UPI001E5A2E28|nr:hypothetical protein [Nostoc sp. CHAB 5715]MCC5625038.1 hypothetical protein [Nostoc sp. CHAB 5715]